MCKYWSSLQHLNVFVAIEQNDDNDDDDDDDDDDVLYLKSQCARLSPFQ